MKRSRKQRRPTKRRNLVLNEIRRLQKSTQPCIPRLPFQRVVREVLQQFKNDFRMQGQSIEALRESSEMFLTQMFEDCALVALASKRVTILPRDIRLLKALKESTPNNMFERY